MRYTRYDYKKKKGDNFILWIIGSITFSIIVGMLFYNLFLKENNVVDTSGKNQQESVKEKDPKDSNGKSFGIIQCGVFKDKNNAEATLASINSEATCFIVEEDEGIKLMYGIYNFDQASEKVNSLTGSSVSNFRIKCEIPGDSDEKRAEGVIIEAYLKIINKLTEKDVKAVDTKQFKEWVLSISSEVSNKSEEFNILVSQINQLPDEYKKENQKDSLIQIYNILKKYKQK